MAKNLIPIAVWQEIRRRKRAGVTGDFLMGRVALAAFVPLLTALSWSDVHGCWQAAWCYSSADVFFLPGLGILMTLLFFGSSA